MGRPKIKVIDDSQPQEENAQKSKVNKSEVGIQSRSLRPRKQGKDELVEKLKAELGITEEKLATLSSQLEEKKEEKSEKPEAKSEEEKPKQKPKQGKAKHRSKKYLEAAEKVNPENKYPLEKAVDLVKQTSYSKFDSTVEIHINTNIKNLRGSVTLPYSSGKKIKILAFGKGAEKSGADIIGDDQKLDTIKNNKIDFDVLITTPEWMGKIAPLAKILGPKGLMPNPKNGTITDNLEKAVKEFQSGRLEYKTEQNGKVIHLSLGKVSQPSEELAQNAKVLIQTLGKTKISKVVLSPTLGPGIKLDINSI